MKKNLDQLDFSADSRYPNLHYTQKLKSTGRVFKKNFCLHSTSFARSPWKSFDILFFEANSAASLLLHFFGDFDSLCNDLVFFPFFLGTKRFSCHVYATTIGFIELWQCTMLLYILYAPWALSIPICGRWIYISVSIIQLGLFHLVLPIKEVCKLDNYIH